MSSAQPQTYQQSHHRVVTANHVIRTAEKEGAFILPHLKPHFKILDVGCGPGTITSGFAKYVPNGSVTGIDTTTEVIEEAHEHLDKLNPKPSNVSFEVGNILEGLRFEDGTFDAVFCHQTLVHIVDPVKAMREMKRLCAPGGFVAAREGDFPLRCVPDLPGAQLLNKYMYLLIMGNISAHPEQPDNPPYAEGHRGGSLIHVWARKAGFDPLRIVKDAKVQLITTPEDRSQFAGNMIGRIEKAGWRKKFTSLGASEEDIQTILDDFKKWVDDVDGWYAIMQCETISWK